MERKKDIETGKAETEIQTNWKVDRKKDRKGSRGKYMDYRQTDGEIWKGS